LTECIGSDHTTLEIAKGGYLMGLLEARHPQLHVHVQLQLQEIKIMYKIFHTWYVADEQQALSPVRTVRTEHVCGLKMMIQISTPVASIKLLDVSCLQSDCCFLRWIRSYPSLHKTLRPFD
jgi:hypothetical protein